MHFTKAFGMPTLPIASAAFGTALQKVKNIMPAVTDEQSTGYIIVVSLAVFFGVRLDCCSELGLLAYYGGSSEDAASQAQATLMQLVIGTLNETAVLRAEATCTVKFRTELVHVSQVCSVLWDRSVLE